MGAHLPRPREDLRLITKQGTLTAFRTGEGWKEERRREMKGGEEVKIYEFTKMSLIYFLHTSFLYPKEIFFIICIFHKIRKTKKLEEEEKRGRRMKSGMLGGAE